MNSNFESAIERLDDRLKLILNKINNDLKKDIQEVRIRSDKPLMIRILSKNYYVYNSGKISIDKLNSIYITSQDQLSESFNRLCEYSLYTYQEQINNGFIILKGGHRAGIVGSVVLRGNEIVNIKDISSINIRIARLVPNAAKEIIENVMNYNLEGLLICGRPGSGKTTILKDIISQISRGKFKELYNISVIDERGEIAGGCGGDSFNYLGDTVDIFDGYPKVRGMMMAIRTMTPDLIVCDEIGSEEETIAIESILNAGVKIIATIHASNEEEVYIKPQIKRLIATKAFKKIIILSSGKTPCEISKVISIM